MIRAFLALLVLGASQAEANDSLWSLLKGGGQVVLIRHTITTPGVGDPPGFRLEDCATQRNLTDPGRGHAKRIGEAWAFGKSEVSQPLGNLFGRPENREKQVEQMKVLVSARPKRGNLVLVSHGSTISALTGVSPGTGEMVVVTPQGGGKFAVAGRLGVN